MDEYPNAEWRHDEGSVKVRKAASVTKMYPRANAKWKERVCACVCVCVCLLLHYCESLGRAR